jgi:hypothetical protein
MGTREGLVDLRLLHSQYEFKVSQIKEKLDSRAALKKVDYEECVELSTQSSRMINKWRRASSISTELQNELSRELYKIESETSQMEVDLVKDVDMLQRARNENNAIDELIQRLRQKLSLAI